MTNEMIIETESRRLAEEGKLNMVDIGCGCMIPEAIHTFAVWKSMGYSVKKGEHAIAQFVIWKNAVKMIEKDGKEEEHNSMFMKKASFFKCSQVEKIVPKK